MFERQVKSICPVCEKNIDGKYYEDEGRILFKKSCAQHGEVIDLVSSDAELFKDKISLFDHFKDYRCNIDKCKEGIFACSVHENRKAPLAFIEITTRCNMKCPVCYASADTKGKDMPREDVYRILEKIKKEDENTHVILIGGEPTIHPYFFDILKKIDELGLMKRAFVATNGITLANKEFSKKVYDAGVRKYYLGFDGTDQRACATIRGDLRAYEALRKALENIRENGKARIILSFTASKNVNLHNLADAIKFSMDNQDIVKRLTITPEVFTGRIKDAKNLVNDRVTGDCVENYIRKELGIEQATIPLSLFYILLKPLKYAGLVNLDKWATSQFSPTCGHMGLVGVRNGKVFSMIDRLVKNPRRNVFKAGREIDALSDDMQKHPGKLPAYLYYLPRYLFILFKYANKNIIMEALGAFLRYGASSKKFKKAFIGEKKVELYYLLGSDRYNFIWDRLVYCATHHYRIHPVRGDVVKLPGCLVFPFRETLE
ncbi:MAG: radical SAM protein [Candidatus Omnitrophota bacterium]